MLCPRCHIPTSCETLDRQPAAASTGRGPYRTSPLLESESRSPDEILVYRCHVCHGIWLDRGKLFAVITRVEVRELPTAADDGQDLPELSCPRCDVAMEHVSSVAVGSVCFARCKSCGGVWFAREEVMGLYALMTRNFA